MMVNTSALMTTRVGIITKMRRTVYCSMVDSVSGRSGPRAAQSSNQNVSGR